MKRISKYILATVFSCVCGSSFAQGFNSAYFVEGYKLRHQLNPAFANENNYAMGLLLGNVQAKVQGNFGVGDVVMDNPMYPATSSKKLTTFLNPYISVSKALEGFSKGNNRLVADLDYSIFTMGFKAFGGYNTIDLDVRANVGFSAPYELFEFAKNTGNQTYNIGDISAGVNSFVQLGFGHSRQITDQLRLGAKMKLLFGVARADLSITNLTADLSDTKTWTMTGNAEAQISSKGARYESELEDYDSRPGQYERVDDVDLNTPGLNGMGLGFDFGAEYVINDDWKVSASLLDLGFISWNDNIVARNMQSSFEFNGFHDVAIHSDEINTFDDQTDKYGDQIADFLNLTDQGKKEGRTTGIGATLNLGCQYTLPAYRKVTFGLLSSTRFNGDYTWTEGRLSANVAPLKWLDGGVNFSVNSFAASMGWVVNVHTKCYNIFLGMDNLLGKMSKQGIPLHSNASFALGMSFSW